MEGMFSSAEFNQDISDWDVLNVVDMGFMFAFSKFDKNINSWDISSVDNMCDIFYGSEFNQDLTLWKNKLKSKAQLKFIKNYIKKRTYKKQTK
jgi:hypothetical protein